jgi:hypothetical protein
MQDLRSNWAEVIGQGLPHSAMTKKNARIVLILEKMKERKFLIRLNTTIEHINLSIDIWYIANVDYQH